MIESLLCFIAAIILNVLTIYIPFPALVVTIFFWAAIATGSIFVIFCLIKLVKFLKK